MEMVNHTSPVAVAVKSIGCRTNQEEMVALSGMITKLGYKIVNNVAEADIVMVNTCSVTETTESKTRRFLDSLSREAPQARILVTGCLAQQKPFLLKKTKNVTWVVGNLHKHDIGTILQQKPEGIYHTHFEKETAESLVVNEEIISPEDPAIFRTRFPVKIQEGCDNQCSYCIVPLLRGPSRSAPFDKIISLCASAIRSGYKEIVLTGTHIGQFSHDNCHRLADLVEKLIGLEGDFRIRLSSLDPRDCSSKLLDIIGQEKKTCNHLHVSLQSGSLPLLDAMHRPTENLPELIDRLISFRDRYPDAGIGADIIVGFPGETDAMFNDTCAMVERIGLSYIHAFRYSKRPGTTAALMTAQIDAEIKNERSNHLRTIVAKSRRSFIKRSAVIPQRIIVESSCPVRGLTSNYLHVEIPRLHALRNSWLDVYISEPVHGRFCSAKPIAAKAA